MCKDEITERVKNNLHKNQGFSLVELCVVLALIAIVMTMSVSFTALVNGVIKDHSEEYEFSEDVYAVREAIYKWLAENDSDKSIFSVSNNALTVNTSDGNKELNFENGTLSLGKEQIPELDTIEGITFSTNGALIKGTVLRMDGSDARDEISFVFYPRCGTVVSEDVTDE